ncbi:MAG: hypothetical protein ACI85I_001275 [Arenicella sp.]|jgi:hypothetical protein
MFKVFKKVSFMSWFSPKKKQFPKSLVIYLSSELNDILIAPQFVDESWVHYEQEEIQQMDFDCENELLGKAIKDNLDKFKEKNREETQRKIIDWPAYKASKLKSVKEFEKKFTRISICGANEANTILCFDADMKSKYGIDLRSSISTYAKDKEIGFLVKKLYRVQLERKIE